MTELDEDVVERRYMRTHSYCVWKGSSVSFAIQINGCFSSVEGKLSKISAPTIQKWISDVGVLLGVNFPFIQFLIEKSFPRSGQGLLMDFQTPSLTLERVCNSTFHESHTTTSCSFGQVLFAVTFS